MNASEIIAAIDSGLRISDINPDNPWSWALDYKGSADFPEIYDLATEILAIKPNQHTTRKFTGGKDSVSVIMTVYNSMNFMLPSIFSVLKQTHSNLELIIVDDCSTDGTYDVLHRISKLDQRIKIIRCPRNLGTYWAKNFGMEKSVGRYLTFMDSDDLNSSERIRRVVKELLSDSKLVMTFCDYIRINSVDGNIVLNRGEVQRGALIGMAFDKERVISKIGWFDSMRVNADDEMKQRIRTVFGTKSFSHVQFADYYASLRPNSLTTSGYTSNSIDKIDESRNTRSFLAPVRQKYTNAYIDWHRSSPRHLYVNYPQWSRPFEAPNSIVCEPAKVVQKTALVFNTEGRDLPSWFDRIKVMFDKVILLTEDVSNPFHMNLGHTISTVDGVKQWVPRLLDELTPGPVVFASSSFPLNKWEVTRLLLELSMHEEPVVVAYDGLLDDEEEVIFNGLPTGDSREGDAKLVRDSGMAMIWSDHSGWQNAIKSGNSLSEIVAAVCSYSGAIQNIISRPDKSSLLDDRWRDERFRWLILHRETEIDPIIKSNEEQPDEEYEAGTGGYDHNNRWRVIKNKLFFDALGLEIWFEMPEDWSFDQTHQDLFRLAEYVLLGKEHKDIIEGWVPSRKAGLRPGLAFSAGVDSTAAMCLMPQRTVLFYGERAGFETQLRHDNANRFIEHLETKIGRPVIRIKSNHELIRTLDGKSPGFSTDYACAVGAILCADLFDLDSVGTGMPLENSYLFHGQKYREFSEGWFWKHYSPLFANIGLPIYQPVSGCSEIVNAIIVEKYEFEDFAQSCLRASAGEVCGACWKCFRKNTLNGYEFTFSNEIETFLGKRPLKMAVSTLYMLQKIKDKPVYNEINEKFPDLQEMMQIDLSWLETHHIPALELIPKQYRDYTTKMLDNLVPRMDPTTLETVDFT
mgnify:CR=1 FL=1